MCIRDRSNTSQFCRLPDKHQSSFLSKYNKLVLLLTIQTYLLSPQVQYIKQSTIVINLTAIFEPPFVAPCQSNTSQFCRLPDKHQSSFLSKYNELVLLLTIQTYLLSPQVQYIKQSTICIHLTAIFEPPFVAPCRSNTSQFCRLPDKHQSSFLSKYNELMYLLTIQTYLLLSLIHI